MRPSAFTATLQRNLISKKPHGVCDTAITADGSRPRIRLGRCWQLGEEPSRHRGRAWAKVLTAGASDGVSFGWELNINLDLENFRTQFKLMPELTGKYVEAQLRPSYSAALGTFGDGEGVEVAWTLNGLVDYISDAETRGVSPLQWSYTAGINLLF